MTGLPLYLQESARYSLPVNYESIVRKFNWVPFDGTGKGWFFSDLHIRRDAGADRDLRKFVEQFETKDELPEWIVWGGDVFDFLVGENRYAVASSAWFIGALHRFSELGVRQYMLEGNHDFHLDWLSQEINNFIVAPDGLEDPNRQLRVVHGDFHAPGKIYGPMRTLFRRKETKSFLEMFPDGIVDKVATRWSNGSYAVRGQTVEEKYLESVLIAFTKHMSEKPGMQWISGHIHYPATLNTPFGAWWINGAWQPDRTFIEIIGSYAKPTIRFQQVTDDTTAVWDGYDNL